MESLTWLVTATVAIFYGVFHARYTITFDYLPTIGAPLTQTTVSPVLLSAFSATPTRIPSPTEAAPLPPTGHVERGLVPHVHPYASTSAPQDPTNTFFGLDAPTLHALLMLLGFCIFLTVYRTNLIRRLTIKCLRSLAQQLDRLSDAQPEEVITPSPEPDGLHSVMATFQRQVENLERLLTAFRAQNADLRTEMRQRDQDHDDCIASMKQELASMKQELTAEQGRCERAEEIAELRESKLKESENRKPAVRRLGYKLKMSRMMDEGKKFISTLKDRIRDLESENADLETQTKEPMSQNGSLSKTQADFAARNAELEKELKRWNERKVNASRLRKADAEELSKVNAALRSEVHELKLAARQLRDQNELLEAKKASEEKSTLDMTRRKVQVLRERAQRLKTERKYLMDEASGERKALDDLKEQCQSQKATLDIAAQVPRLEESIRGLSSEKQALQNQLETGEEERGAQESRLEECRNTISQLQQRLSAGGERVAGLETQVNFEKSEAERKLREWQQKYEQTIAQMDGEINSRQQALEAESRARAAAVGESDMARANLETQRGEYKSKLEGEITSGQQALEADSRARAAAVGESDMARANLETQRREYEEKLDWQCKMIGAYKEDADQDMRDYKQAKDEWDAEKVTLQQEIANLRQTISLQQHTDDPLLDPLLATGSTQDRPLDPLLAAGSTHDPLLDPVLAADSDNQAQNSQVPPEIEENHQSTDDELDGLIGSGDDEREDDEDEYPMTDLTVRRKYPIQDEGSDQDSYGGEESDIDSDDGSAVGSNEGSESGLSLSSDQPSRRPQDFQVPAKTLHDRPMERRAPSPPACFDTNRQKFRGYGYLAEANKGGSSAARSSIYGSPVDAFNGSLNSQGLPYHVAPSVSGGYAPSRPSPSRPSYDDSEVDLSFLDKPSTYGSVSSLLDNPDDHCIKCLKRLDKMALGTDKVCMPCWTRNLKEARSSGDSKKRLRGPEDD